MRNFFTLITFLVFSFYTFADNKIQLEDHYKVIGTFSGDIEKSNSFHIVIAKNKESKMYEIIPVSYFEMNLIRLPSISFKKQPSIKSFHSNNNVVSLIVAIGNSYPIQKKILDVNFVTGEYKLSKSITVNKLKAIVRKEDKSYIITGDEGRLYLTKIKSSDQLVSVKIVKGENNALFFKKISNSSFSAVDTDEFVKNGPVQPYKVYCYDDDVMYITKDNFSKKHTSVISVMIDTTDTNTNIGSVEFSYERFKSPKEASSFLHNGKVFQFVLDKKLGLIKITDFKTHEYKSLLLKEELLYSKGEGFDDLNNFLDQASKGKYKSTITVNESTDGRLIIRCDYVNPTVYGYNYNWWWHHQQFIWHHQQMMMNNIPKFGPNSNWFNAFKSFDYYAKDHYFEIVLDKECNIITNNGETIKPLVPTIEKKKYTKEVDEDESIDFVSSVFLKDEFVYFYFDKNYDSFRVSKKAIIND
ncbi:hypothetical protein [Aestuariivivens insulae]|uniref:hypothetical protein n=1 Tax=Aestuariivivens insulae TaxID=1621988 RepID=UPI001F5A64CF|nr:hypothetical protein [Aestuariivivens insulae]